MRDYRGWQTTRVEVDGGGTRVRESAEEVDAAWKVKRREQNIKERMTE